MNVRNEKAPRRAGIERELSSRMNQRVLRWFKHMMRMDEYRMARKVLTATEITFDGWCDGGINWHKGMTVEAERQCAKDI